MGPVQWHWATDLVGLQQGSTDDLLIKLASGELPPFVLVWRPGWANWLPAMQVAELSYVLPVGVVGALYQAQEALPGAGRPQLPISEFPRLRQLARSSLRTGTSRVRSVAQLEQEDDVPTWATREFNYPEQDEVTSEVPESDLMQAALAMQQLIPPGDLQLGGARNERLPGRASNDADVLELLSPDHPSFIPLLSESPSPSKSESAIPLLSVSKSVAESARGGGRDERVLSPLFSTQEPPAQPPQSLLSRALAAQLALSEQQTSQPLTSQSSFPSESGSNSVLTPVSSVDRWLAALSAHPARVALCVAALVGIAVFSATRAAKISPEQLAGGGAREQTSASQQRDTSQGGQLAEGNGPLDDTGSAPAVLQAAAVLSPVCRPLGEPVRLDKWALPEIPPILRPVPHSSQVAIGYAKSREQARGLLLDVGTLKFDRVFSDNNKRNIYSVTPLAGSPKTLFRVERSSARMAYSRALETKPPMRLGMNDASVVLGPFEGRPDKIWPLPHGAFTSLPSVAETTDGLAIAIRVRLGRDKASIQTGLLSRAGRPQTSLVRLDIPEANLSRPVIVVGDKDTALAVVSRDKSGRDRFYVARAPNGSLPSKAVELDLFGPRVRLRSPILAALPDDGGYALGWTEGKGFRRQVRLLKLDKELKPVGPPADITAINRDLNGAVSGSLYWLAPDKPVAGDGQHLLLFHFIARDRAHSLWVSDIACEPAQVGI